MDTLADLRRARKITQRELARRMGTSHSQISRIESGRTVLRVSTVARYVDGLGGRIEVSAVFDGERHRVA